MKAIIVAAGMGRRLSPYTDDRPKTLVEVNGRSILARQVDAYRAAGVDDIYIVRGYMKEKIVVEGARYFDNDDYRNNNILTSFTLVRKLPRFYTALTITYDANNADTSVVFTAWPEGFPASGFGNYTGAAADRRR